MRKDITVTAELRAVRAARTKRAACVLPAS